MNSISKNNLKAEQIDEQNINSLNNKLNEDNQNNSDEEEINLENINKNMENNIENENSYNNSEDNNLNLKQKEENLESNEELCNNDYIIEKIKNKIREEELKKEEMNEDEIVSDIYDLPLSLNNISNNIIDNINSEEKEIKNEQNLKKIENKKIYYKKEIYQDKKFKKTQTIKDSNKINNNKNGQILDKKDFKNGKNENNLESNNNKQILEISPKINPEKEENKNNLKIQSLEIPEGVKFGVDETGNPIKISQFIEENKNNDNNKSKIIAFIMQKEGIKNFLVDIKGNILQKTEDDYYLYKEGNDFIIIKDFDIQNPELRVYGHSKININEKKKDKNEENNNNNIKINSNKKSINKKDNENGNIVNEIKKIMENKNILKDKNNKEKKELSVSSNNVKIKDKNKYLLNNNTNKTILKTKSTNNSIIFIENKQQNIQKINNINTSNYVNNVNNINNDEQMYIWRKRYGQKKAYDKKNNYRSNSCNYIPNDKIVFRTDSILKITSEKNKNNKIPINKKSYTNNKYNIISQINYIKENKGPVNKKGNNSFTKNLDNPILKSSNNKNNYDLLNLRNNKNSNHLKRNKTLQYINDQYNIINNDFNSFIDRNIDIEYDDIKERYNIKNMKQKYKYKNKENDESKEFNYFNNSINNNKIKNKAINNYIYNNIRKINENKNKKKKFRIKCSILSNEANKVIKDFNIRQKEKESEHINLDNKYYDRYIPKKYINRNNIFKKKNYTSISQNQNVNLFFDYQNDENENPNFYFNYNNQNLIQNQKQNKFEILNNNNFEKKYIINSNINQFYRKIKHNTSKNNNFF